MRLPPACSPLAEALSSAFHEILTPGQHRALTAWVAGALLAGTACQSLVVTALVEALAAGRPDTVRAPLREFLYDGPDHRAPSRGQVDPTACFAALLRWLLTYWRCPQVALALDVTTHTDTLTAIVVSLLTRGRAIPVAWPILPGNQPGAFIAPALTLLQALAPALADRPGMTVTLAADRGLWSPRLADQVAALGWQPLLRVQRDVSIWLGRGQRVRADRLVPGPGHAWVGRVLVHKERVRQRVQTVLVVWQPGAAEPWVVFPTGPVSTAPLRWYGLRMWIETGFRDRGRLGWQWERTRRRAPRRVARHWLVLAVATAWTLAHGGQPPDTPAGVLPPRPRRASTVSAFQRGRLLLLGLLLGARTAPWLDLTPAPWPPPQAAGLRITIGPTCPPTTLPPHPPPINVPL